jgi:hypothetical protein
LKPDFIENCVDALKSNNSAKNQTILRVLRSLLIHDKRSVAEELVKRVVLQDHMEKADKEFLKKEFNINMNVDGQS